MTGESEKKRRILYVEDDPSLRMSTFDMLEDMGHLVTEAADAPTALEWLRAGHAVDVLMTDMRMPVMDGRELVTKARALRPELTVVFTTGSSDKSVRDITKDSRTGYLLKPFAQKDLEKLLQSLD